MFFKRVLLQYQSPARPHAEKSNLSLLEKYPIGPVSLTIENLSTQFNKRLVGTNHMDSRNKKKSWDFGIFP